MMRKLKWVICSCCEGSGQAENPAFTNGFTSSEWHEMPIEEQQAYMVGEYDVVCEECEGTGKVRVPDVEAMSFAEKRQHLKEMRQHAAENAAESAVYARENGFNLG